MAKITTSDGMTKAEMPSESRHPDSHFRTSRVEIEPSDNGGFTVSHHQSLKKEHENNRGYYGSWREAKKMVFEDASAMHEHVAGLFPAKKK